MELELGVARNPAPAHHLGVPAATALAPGGPVGGPLPIAQLAPAHARPPAAEPAIVARPPAPRAVSGYIPRPMACCWPIGEPGTKSFHFCEAEAVPGKPYCAEHAHIAYVKVRDRREEAA